MALAQVATWRPRPGICAIRVLLIEDSLGDAVMVTRRLEWELGSLDHIVLERAVTLEEGIDRLGKSSIDVVLLDLNLPDSAGSDTVRRLRAEEPTIPIVVLTSAGEGEVSVRALQAGAQAYLSKSDFEAGTLLYSTIRNAIESPAVEAAFGFDT
jgi:DNA-binding NarL/FixJ family response regulator